MDPFRGVCWIQTVYSRKARDHAKLSVVQLIIPCGANIEDESFSANRQQCVQGNLELQFTAEATLVIQRRRQRKSRGNLLKGNFPTVDKDVKLRRHAAQAVVARRELHVTYIFSHQRDFSSHFCDLTRIFITLFQSGATPVPWPNKVSCILIILSWVKVISVINLKTHAF